MMFLRLIVGALLFVAGSESGVAQESVTSQGHTYAKAIEQKARFTAESEFLRTENDLLNAENRSGGSVFLSELSKVENPELKQRLDSLLSSTSASLGRSVAGSVRVENQLVGELQRDLENARDRLIVDRRVLLEVRAQRQFSGQLASLINVDNKWMWLGGVVAFGTLLLLIAHDRRHMLRRLMWVRRTRAVALVAFGLFIFLIPLLPTIITFALGDQTFETLLALTSRDAGDELGEDPAKELKELQAQIVKLGEEHNALEAERKQLMLKRQQSLAESFGGQAAFADEWTRLREDVSRNYISVRVPELMSATLESETQRLQDLEKKVGEEQQGIESYGKMKRLLGAGVGLSLLAVVVFSGLFFQRSVSKKQKLTSDTCPRCLSVGKLVKVDAVGSPASGAAADLSEVRCTNIVEEQTGEECDFMFHAQYRPRVKISFPTLGIAQSGKTHWLAMAYQQLNLGQKPAGVHLDSLKASGADKFDRIVKDLLQNRVNPAATQISYLPEPLLYGFRDRDRFGTDIIVNMFDFAGTVTISGGLHDATRIRQLNSEGFLFFLDPTMESGTQVEALAKFRREVKLVKGLGTKQKLHTPVALCLSKLDLTVCQHYALGGDTLTSFFKDLSHIDSTTKSMSLSRIQQRSELATSLRETIWPGWQIENEFRELFGDRFMFFPMTPVGLPPEGVTDPKILKDLSQRTIAPYGIIEPLMWLLHMNGYPVLDR